MSITETYKLSEQLADCLNAINALLEEKAIAYHNIEYWSSHEDLFDNLGQAIKLVPTIESLIALNEDKIKLIINQLNNEIQCINQNQ